MKQIRHGQQLERLPAIFFASGCDPVSPEIKMSRLVIFLAAELMQPSLIMAALTRDLKRHCVLQSISAKNIGPLWQRGGKGVTPE